MIHKTTRQITRAFCCVGLLVGLAVVGLPEKAEAVLMTDGSNEADYRNLAKQYSNSVAYLKLYDNIGPYYGSGVFLNSSWVLTAAHVVVSPFGTGDGIFYGVVQGTSSQGALNPTLETHVYPG